MTQTYFYLFLEKMSEPYNRLQNTLIAYGQNMEEELDEGFLQQCIDPVSPRDRFKIIAYVRRSGGCTSIHAAACMNHFTIIRILLTSLSEELVYKLLEIPNHRAMTAMHIAALEGHTESMEELRRLVSQEQWYTLLQAQTFAMETAVHYASILGQTSAMICMLRSLSTKQVKDLLSIEDEEGRQPLRLAKELGKTHTAHFINRCLESYEEGIH